jgi:poly(3-hydroxybutyrate) depolymerase/surface polysaccharide O-acyltransferase-like enzyme
VSSTLSSTGPQPGPAAAAGPAGAAKPRQRPHIVAFDLIRLIIMVFVVSVHTLSFAGGAVTMSVGAVTTVFHTSRELFLLLTALVLTYNYGHRPRSAGRFWRRRFWLVVPAYITWSAIYYAADGRSRGAFPSAFLHDLENAGARYHLYFLLVSMQIYLLFPLIKWVLKKTERNHVWVFAAALAYQAWLTVALHYRVGRDGNGIIAQFLNGAGLGYWVDTYVLYVVAGALAGWHFEQLCAFTRRHLGNGWRVAAVAAAGVTAGIGVFLIETEVFGATPDNASAVFQPVCIVEALAFGWALLGAGLLWSASVSKDGGPPGRKFCAAGSASSFGIYLAHPLVLQVLLLVLGSRYFGADGGVIGWLHRLPHSSIEVLILLFVAVPVVYACAWAIASVMRRTPLSLFLTGREWKPGRKFRLGTATDRLLDTIEGKVTAGAARIPRRVLVIALAVVLVATTGSITAAKVVAAAGRTMNTATYSMQVGDLTRSYTVLTPAKTALKSSAPIIMVLSGLNSTQDQEITRDQLTSYATAGDAELVYPLAYRESWNALGCCSWAAIAAVDDTGFITRLVSVIDPGHARPIYVVGYSNGGRLAYRLDCTNPLLFDGTVIVKSDPMPGCSVVVPMKIMTIAAANDTDVPYKPGEKGTESPAATVQNADLRSSSQCTTTSQTVKQGMVTYTLWPDCANGTSVGFAVYSGGVHSFPRPPGSYPAASQVIWAFINGTTSIQAQPKKV